VDQGEKIANRSQIIRRKGQYKLHKRIADQSEQIPVDDYEQIYDCNSGLFRKNVVVVVVDNETNHAFKNAHET
jgi:hypothetical protein